MVNVNFVQHTFFQNQVKENIVKTIFQFVKQLKSLTFKVNVLIAQMVSLETAQMTTKLI